MFYKKYENRLGKVISIDVPTGLCPDNGEPFVTGAVKADFTLVIGLNKIGLIQDSALPFVGELNHIDIGFTSKQLSKVDGKILKITYQDIKEIQLDSLAKIRRMKIKYIKESHGKFT